MAAAFVYVLDGIVLEEFLHQPIRQRERLLTIFRRLAENPNQKGETFFLDSTRRQIQRKLFDQWQISFWSDHAVKEVRIVGIQRVRR
jgi:hypothetical protein